MHFQHLTFAAKSDTGRKRQNNEDAFGVFPAQGVFCVADGMGGGDDGEVASAETVKAIATFSRECAMPADKAYPIETRLRLLSKYVDMASRGLCARTAEKGLKGCGSTLVGIMFDPARPAVAMAFHAGDSRLYRVRGRSIRQITQDHSAAALIGAKNDDDVNPMFRGMVLRAVGLANTVAIERTEVKLKEGDTIVICSDGLSRMVSDKTISLLVRERVEPSAISEALVDAANEAGGIDNVTAVVVRVGKLPKAVPETEPGIETAARSGDTTEIAGDSQTIDTRTELTTAPASAATMETISATSYVPDRDTQEEMAAVADEDFPSAGDTEERDGEENDTADDNAPVPEHGSKKAAWLFCSLGAIALAVGGGLYWAMTHGNGDGIMNPPEKAPQQNTDAMANQSVAATADPVALACRRAVEDRAERDVQTDKTRQDAEVRDAELRKMAEADAERERLEKEEEAERLRIEKAREALRLQEERVANERREAENAAAGEELRKAEEARSKASVLREKAQALVESLEPVESRITRVDEAEKLLQCAREVWSEDENYAALAAKIAAVRTWTAIRIKNGCPFEMMVGGRKIVPDCDDVFVFRRGDVRALTVEATGYETLVISNDKIREGVLVVLTPGDFTPAAAAVSIDWKDETEVVRAFVDGRQVERGIVKLSQGRHICRFEREDHIAQETEFDARWGGDAAKIQPGKWQAGDALAALGAAEAALSEKKWGDVIKLLEDKSFASVVNGERADKVRKVAEAEFAKSKIAEERKLLIDARKALEEHNWKEVAELLEGREFVLPENRRKAEELRKKAQEKIDAARENDKWKESTAGKLLALADNAQLMSSFLHLDPEFRLEDMPVVRDAKANIKKGRFDAAEWVAELQRHMREKFEMHFALRADEALSMMPQEDATRNAILEYKSLFDAFAAAAADPSDPDVQLVCERLVKEHKRWGALMGLCKPEGR